MVARNRGERRPTAFVGGRLVDGTGRDPLQDSVVVTSGGTIEAVGSKDKVRVPDECHVIDVAGMTIMPGMMDMHVHLGATNDPMISGASLLSPALGRN